jgi:hypothetical protein
MTRNQPRWTGAASIDDWAHVFKRIAVEGDAIQAERAREAHQLTVWACVFKRIAVEGAHQVIPEECARRTTTSG